jgi:FkbM family methyltransferase
MSALDDACRLVRAVWTHPENRHRRLRAVATLLAWQGWERVVGRPWTIHLAGGRKLRVYPHSHSATEALYFGLGEARDMRFTLDFLAPGDVFVDVGANVGVYSLLASSIPDVNIEAFEPSPEAFSRLGENVRLNRLETRVTTYQTAVGDIDGVARLTQGRDCWNHLTAATDGDALEVPIVRLDAVVPRSPRRVSLMKIDVEGHEAAVLAGATATLCADHPALIVEGEWEKVAPVVEPLGYAPFEYDTATRTLKSSRVRRGNNLLLLADVDDARLRLAATRPSAGTHQPTLSLIRRLVLDVIGVWRTADRATARRWTVALVTNAATIFRTGNLEAADHALADRTCTFRIQGVEVVLPGEYFSGAREIYCRRVYSPAHRFDIGANDVVVDLGCNVGVFTTLAARAGREVIAVEAQGDMIDRAEANLELNGGVARTRLVHALVGADSGFFHGDQEALADPAIGNPRSKALAEVLGDVPHVDLMKIDVEGSEFALFAEDRERPWLHKVERIAMEVHPEFGDVTLLESTLAARGLDYQLMTNHGAPTPTLDAIGYLFAWRSQCA